MRNLHSIPQRSVLPDTTWFRPVITTGAGTFYTEQVEGRFLGYDPDGFLTRSEFRHFVEEFRAEEFRAEMRQNRVPRDTVRFEDWYTGADLPNLIPRPRDRG